MTNHTVTIGIPAFNEEENIKKLLTSVLAQKTKGFRIERIILSSDGSTDGTVQKARSIKSNKIAVLANNNRAGIARGLNQIIKMSKSDVLVTIDGDIKIKDSLFIQKIVEPIIESRADLTSSAILEVKPKSFYGKMIYLSMALKTVLFDVFKSGNNVYTCHGLARAYSKRFYKTLNFPNSIGNDMYSYLKCLSQGFKYSYIKSAITWYRLPENFNDHKKQSTRFYKTLSDQKKYFEANFFEKEVGIPIKDYFLAFLKSLTIILNHPIHLIVYFFMQIYISMAAKKVDQPETWDMALSTKKYD